MSDEPRSFNPGRWSVRGLVFGTAIAAEAMLAGLAVWGSDSDLHLAIVDVCRVVLVADLVAFTGGVVGEVVATVWGSRR